VSTAFLRLRRHWFNLLLPHRAGLKLEPPFLPLEAPATFLTMSHLEFCRSELQSGELLPLSTYWPLCVQLPHRGQCQT
jgi:hypothetical protein